MQVRARTRRLHLPSQCFSCWDLSVPWTDPTNQFCGTHYRTDTKQIITKQSKLSFQMYQVTGHEHWDVGRGDLMLSLGENTPTTASSQRQPHTPTAARKLEAFCYISSSSFYILCIYLFLWSWGSNLGPSTHEEVLYHWPMCPNLFSTF